MIRFISHQTILCCLAFFILLPAVAMAEESPPPAADVLPETSPAGSEETSAEEPSADEAGEEEEADEDEPTQPQQPTTSPAQPTSPAASEEPEDVAAPRRQRTERAPEHHRSTLLRRSVYNQGRWSLGVDGIFSRTTSRVELLDDNATATDTTRFMRVEPYVTVGLIDRLHIGLIPAFISRRIAREDAESTTESAYAIQPLIQYYLTATPRLAFYVQGAPGYFRGRSERNIPDEDDAGNIIGEADTTTRGFLLTLGGGISYRLSEGVQLRFGLTHNSLWGRESVEDLERRFSTSTHNLGTTAGIRYTF